MVGIFLIWPSKKGLDGSLCNVCCVYVDQKSNMANTADDHMGNEKKNSQKLEIWLNPNYIDNWQYMGKIFLYYSYLKPQSFDSKLRWNVTKCMSIMNILRDKKVTCKSSA